ncbi:dehydrogenase [Hyaloraphidium curvatum]|nr:dehydrogenase [Hyaloraphidium curvatum]
MPAGPRFLRRFSSTAAAMSLKGRVACVSGSTGGIGHGIARALAAEGAHVMLNGFGDRNEIEAFRAELESRGVRVEYNPADMSDGESCADLVKDTEARLGKCDILVNCAGIQHVAPVESFPVDKWNAVLAINLSSAFHTSRAALPGMKARKWGRIINIASTHGLVASAEKSAYVAAKHGLIGLTKVIALETAGSGVTSNAVCPGWVLTPLVQKQIDARAAAKGIPVEQAALELVSEKHPSQTFTTPEQVGAMVVFLCSPAADNMTGSSVTMDGAWTAQ